MVLFRWKEVLRVDKGVPTLQDIIPLALPGIPNYPNLHETVLGVYVLMLGDWDTENFVRSEHPLMATVLFLSFTFVMMIILFNL